MKVKILIIMITLFGFFSCSPNSRIIEEKTKTGIKLIYKPKKSIYSGFQLKLIPLQIDLSLDKDMANSVIKLLSEKFPNKEISLEIDSIINFVDCGQGFEKVICPFCEKEISIETWQESMSKAFDTQFKNMSFKVPCCNKQTTLDLLKYESECGFSKSTITIISPDSEINEKNLLSELKDLTNIDFKVINVNY